MTMIDPAIVPQRTLYTGAKMPAVGMGTLEVTMQMQTQFLLLLQVHFA